MAQACDCHELRVSHLHFGFDGFDVLHDICLEAKKGQIIGITGAVGSGKTTLAHALLGQYPYKGSITVDGKELSSLPPDTRWSLIAYTGHEQFLFSMSIRDNIRFSSEEGPSLSHALSAAALTEDVNRFDKGLETPVGEKGVRISGGQRQRISLARAIHSGSPILILDDPFSAVDIATEAAIIDRLKKDYADRIVLLFTHRLAAFRHADLVLVLEKGCVTQHGTHEALMAQDGLYRDIHGAQTFMEADAHAE